jgi:hypothetical protein
LSLFLYSSDVEGKALKILWEKYLSSSKEDCNSNLLIFLESFIETYSKVIVNSKTYTRPYKNTTGIAIYQPDSIADTEGHLTSVIIEVVTLLHNELDISFTPIVFVGASPVTKFDRSVSFSDSDSETSTRINSLGSYSCPSIRDISSSVSNLVFAKSVLNVKLMNCFEEDRCNEINDETKNNGNINLDNGRKRFSLLIETLEVLSYWSNDCKIIQDHLGIKFAECLEGILTSFLDKIERLIDPKQYLETLNFESFKLARINFIINSLHYVLSFISRSSFASIERDSHSLSNSGSPIVSFVGEYLNGLQNLVLNINHLDLPFTEEFLNQVNFPIYKQQKEAKSIDESSENMENISQIKEILLNKLLNTASHKVESSSSSNLRKGFSSPNLKKYSWAHDLIDSGFSASLLNLISKLSELLNTFVALRSGENTNLSSLIISNLWQSMLILQIESLNSFLIFSSITIAKYEHHHVVYLENLLETILISCENYPQLISSSSTEVANRIVLQRGFICLRLKRQLFLHMRTLNFSGKENKNDANGLSHYISWLRDQYKFCFDSKDSECPILSISYEYTSNLHSPDLSFDIWPWNQSKISSSSSSSSSPSSSPYSSTPNEPHYKLLGYDFEYHLCPNKDQTTALYKLILENNSNLSFNGIWKTFFSEFLQICNADFVHFGFYVFENSNGDILINDSLRVLIKAVTLSSEQKYSTSDEFPFFELNLIEFLHELVENSPQQCALLFRDTNIIDVILGHGILLKKILEFDRNNSFCNNFNCEDKEINSNSSSRTWTSQCNPESIHIYGWILVLESTLDLLSKVVKIWYSETPPISSMSTDKQGREIQIVLSFLIQLQENSKSQFGHMIILQLTRWLTHMLKDIKEMNSKSIATVGPTMLKVFNYYIDISTSYLGFIAVRRVKGQWIFDNSIDPNIVSITWPSRVSVLNLIIFLMMPVFGCKTEIDYMNVFLDVSDRSTVADHYNGENPLENRVTFNVKSFEQVNLDLLIRKESKKNKHSALNILELSNTAGIMRIDSILMLLFDPQSRSVAIHILIGILAINADEIKHDKRPTRQSSISTHIIEGLFYFIKESHKYPVWCDSYNTILMILKTWTWLMRSTQFKKQRIVLQNLFVTDLLKNFMESLSYMLEQSMKSLKLESNILRIISLQGLSFLTSIMNSNRARKDDFGIILSSYYKDFIRSVLVTEKIPSLETVVVLFELLLDSTFGNNKLFLIEDEVTQSKGMFANDDDRPKIVNQIMITSIFNVLPKCEINVQKVILSTFLNLVTGRASLVNLTLSTTNLRPQSVLDLSLDLFPNTTDEIQIEIVKLMQTLGRHGISVAQLKHLFFCLQKDIDGTRPAYSYRILQALDGMVSREEGPQHSFVFDGDNSGLQLPSISNWPATRSFSFCLWFRIESPKKSQDSVNTVAETTGNHSSNYKPCILSLRNRNNDGGLEIFLEPTAISGQFRIIIKSYLEDGSPPSTCEPNSRSSDPSQWVVYEGRWHFLAFTLSNGSASYSGSFFKDKGIATVSLDGSDYYKKTDFEFPNLNDIDTPLIGDCLKQYKKLLNTTMRGQLGAIYFFSEALGEGQLKCIYKLGPEYFYCFESSSAVYRDIHSQCTVQDVQASSILDGSLTHKIMLAYNPAVWNKDYFTDNTPPGNKVKWGNFDETNAKGLPGTSRSTTQDVVMALDSLGGIQVILPIFEQFTLPRKFHNPGSEPIIDHSVDINIFEVVLDLFCTLLENTSEIKNRSTLKKCLNFSLIGYFLENVAPSYFNLSIFNRFENLFDSVKWSYSLQHNLIENIFCNFKLWVFTPYSLQMELFEYLENFANEHPLRLRDIWGAGRGSNKLFDSLFLFYDYDKPTFQKSVKSFNEESNQSEADLYAYRYRSLEGTKYADDVWISPNTGEKHGERLKGEELMLIRRKIFNIIGCIINPTTDKSHFIPEHVVSIIQYISLTSSPCSKVEAMSFLLEFLSDPEFLDNQIPFIIYHLVRVKFVVLLTGMTSSICIKIRLYSLLLLCKIVYLSNKYKSLLEQNKLERLSEGHQDMYELNKQFDEINNPSVDFFSVSSPGVFVLSPSNSRSVFANIVLNLLEKMDSDSKESQICQIKIIILALQSTLFGSCCSCLTKMIESDLELLSNNLCSSSVILFHNSSNSVDSSNTLSTTETIEEEILQEEIISNPILFSTLLIFFDDDKIPVTMRLDFIVKLKLALCLQEKNILNSNFDNIASLTDWIDSLLKLMESENSRYKRMVANHDGTKESEKLLGKSHIVIETCHRMLIDFLIVGIRYGIPNNEVLIKEKSFKYNDILKNVAKGDRILGANLVRDIMFKLSLYNIIDGELLAMNFMRDLIQTFLKSEIYRKNNVTEITKLEEKTIHANIYILSTIIYEFFSKLNSEPIEPSSEIFRSRSPSFVKSSSRTSSAELITNSNIESSRPINVSNDDIDNNLFDEDSTVVHSPYEPNFQKKCWYFTLPVRFEYSLMWRKDYVTFVNGVRIRGQSSDEGGFVNGIHKNVLLYTDNQTRNDLFWGITDDLFDLMWLWIENPSQWMNDDKNFIIVQNDDKVTSTSANDKKKRMVPLTHCQGGICWISVRILCSQFDEIITDMLDDYIMNTMVKDDVRIKRRTSSFSDVVHDVDAYGNNIQPVTTTNSLSIRLLFLLQRIQLLVRSYNDIKPDFYNFESLYIASRLSLILSKENIANLPDNNIWLRTAVDLIVELIIPQSNDIKSHLSNPSSSSIIDPSNKSIDISQSSPILMSPLDKKSRSSTLTSEASNSSSPERSRQVSDANISMFLASNSPLNHSMFENVMKTLNTIDSEKTPMPLSEYTVNAIRTAIQLPNDFALTWDSWMEFMRLIYEQGTYSSPVIIANRLKELKIQNILSQDFYSFTKESNIQGIHCFFNIKKKSLASLDITTDIHRGRVCDYVQYLDITLTKKHESKWKDLYSVLANERGPWGYSSGSMRKRNGVAIGNPNPNVFWMIDACESDQRVRTRIVRNKDGHNHIQATKQSYEGKGKRSAMKEEKTDKFQTGMLKFKAVNAAVVIDPNIENLETGEGDGNGEEGSGDDETKESENNNALLSDTTVLFTAPVDVISCSAHLGGYKMQGVIEITKSRFSFIRSDEVDIVNNNSTADISWKWLKYLNFPQIKTTWFTYDISSLFQRHYLQQFTAVEVFFTSRTGIFFNFNDQAIAKTMYKFITNRALKSPVLYTLPSRKPAIAIKTATRPGTTLTRMQSFLQGEETNTITKLWQRHEVSNFEYLMHLNTIAGRTFNDLSQYPVFPWIIKDYTSKKLDLFDTSPGLTNKTFRDLEWPIGAQTEKQRDQCRTKYRQSLEMYLESDGDDFPPYHHGYHYSNSAYVMGYLIRMEPYTSLHIWLQNGRFDVPDRLFVSIEDSWKGVNSNPGDVKELIPEFYCNPCFLENLNKIDFGPECQNGKKIADVELPPWASDAQDFIRQNRQALESDYVSQNLHKWIDLVFGYKQGRPRNFDDYLNDDENIVHGCNVFKDHTYNGAYNLEVMKSTEPQLYSSSLQRFDKLGQTPVILFNEPHIKRHNLSEYGLIWPIASVIQGIDTIPPNLVDSSAKPRSILCYPEETISQSPILLICDLRSSSNLITVDSHRSLGLHFFKVKEADVVPPFELKTNVQNSKWETAKQSLKKFSGRGSREKRVGVPFAAQSLLSSSLDSTPISNIFDQSYVGDKSKYLKRMKDYEAFLKGESKPGRQSRNPSSSRPSSSRPSSSRPSSSSHSSSRNHLAMLDERTSVDSRDSKISLSMSSPSPRDKMRNVSSSSSRVGMDEDKIRSNVSNQKLRASESQLSSSVGSTNSGGSNTSSPATPQRRKSLTSDLSSTEDKDKHLSCHLFAMIPDCKLLFSCGHWDNSFKVTNVETGRQMQSISHHREVVTCIAAASDFGLQWLVTGSRDCTVMVWEVLAEKEFPVTVSPIHELCGHDDSITCVAVNPELDILVSGSDDGTIIIHSLREGFYIRNIKVGYKDPLQVLKQKQLVASAAGHPIPSVTSVSSSQSSATASALQSSLRKKVQMICISKEGYIVTYSIHLTAKGQENLLCTYSINGEKAVSMLDACERLYTMTLSEDGNVLLTGGQFRLVVFRWVNTLFLAADSHRKGLDAVIDGNEVCFESSIRSLYLTNQERHLLVGLESGHVRILAQDSKYLKDRLTKKLVGIGILNSGDR